MSNRSAPLLDPVATWNTLTPEQQRAIGSAALTWLIGEDDPHADEAWNWEATQVEGLGALRAAYLEIAPIIGADPPRVDLTAIGVRMCIGCGCTQDVACEGGCRWVSRRRCSSCIPSARRCT